MALSRAARLAGLPFRSFARTLALDFGPRGRLSHRRPDAVGAKAADNVSPQDLRGLRAIQEEGRIARRYCVCLEPRRRRVDGIDIVPAVEFITELWEELG